MNELPKMTLVSSSRGECARARLRGWGRSLRTLRRFLWMVPVGLASASGLWCCGQINACTDRNRAACALRDDRRIEIMSISGNTYYTIDPKSSEVLEHRLWSARVFADVPADGRRYLITHARYDSVDIECYVSGEVHLRVNDMR